MSDFLLCAGSTLGAYRLVERLGRGGMGEVWLARQDVSPTVPAVALEVIHSDQSTDAKVRGMFLDEVGIAKAIQHPNVVKISDCQEVSGVLFAVMEYVRGVSLQELLSAAEAKGESIPLTIALRIVVGAVAGLDAAHRLCDSN
jgi:eukaryotic-like serine/threonine-protein kinase